MFGMAEKCVKFKVLRLRQGNYFKEYIICNYKVIFPNKFALNLIIKKLLKKFIIFNYMEFF